MSNVDLSEKIVFTGDYCYDARGSHGAQAAGIPPAALDDCTRFTVKQEFDTAWMLN